MFHFRSMKKLDLKVLCKFKRDVSVFRTTA